jgi:hypothetical protein
MGGYQDHKVGDTTVFQSRHVDVDDENEEEDDGGANEGPSFESSMRSKYPLFHDRRDTSTGMAGR